MNRWIFEAAKIIENVLEFYPAKAKKIIFEKFKIKAMRTFTYFFLFLICFKLSAQIKFEKGYYLNNQNQRIDGYIKNQDWKNNPTEFEFKKQLEEIQSESIQMSDASEFCIEGQSIFKRCDVNIERSTDNLRNLSHDRNPVWKKETLFLKVIVQGKASLYQYVDPRIYKYFYQIENKPVEQLVCIKYFDNQSGSDEVKTNSFYKNQLYNFVRCEDQKMEFFDQISYNQSDLLKQFSKYNNCNGEKVQSKFETPKGIFVLKITAGINNAKLKVDDINYHYNFGTSFSNKIVINGGVEFEYFLPFNKYKWSIFTNPSYAKYSNSEKYTRNIDNNPVLGTVTFNTEVEYNNLEISIGARYHFLINENSKLYLGLAYVFNSSLNSGINVKRDGVLIEDYDVKPNTNFLLGLGYNYHKKIGIECRYYTTTNLLNGYVKMNADYSVMGVVLSYNFL